MEIRHKHSGQVLYSDQRGTLRGANLAYTHLNEAGLGGYDLRGANLVGASLARADLREDDLRGGNDREHYRISLAVGSRATPGIWVSLHWAPRSWVPDSWKKWDGQKQPDLPLHVNWHSLKGTLDQALDVIASH